MKTHKMPGSRTQPTVAAPPPGVTGATRVTRPGPTQRRRSLPWPLIALAAILLALGVLGVLGPDAMNGWFDGSQGDKQSPNQPSRPEKVKVPDVAGLTRSEAEQKLTDVGLEVGQETTVPNDTVAADRVISSDIEAGTPVVPGTKVNLTISSGPQPTSSASSSSSASASPAATATASSSASAQPAQQEDRPATKKPAQAENGPKVETPEVEEPKIKQGPSVRVQDQAAEESGHRGRGRGRGED